MSFYSSCCWVSRKPITSVEFKFVARQVEASVVIREAKLKFVAESRTSSLLCATCCLNFQHCILLRAKLVTNVVIPTTEGFNLQCNNVSRQVEEKCCLYYRTLNLGFSCRKLSRVSFSRVYPLIVAVFRRISVEYT